MTWLELKPTTYHTHYLQCTNLILCGLTWLELKPTTYHTHYLQCTNLILCGLTWLELKPTTYHTHYLQCTNSISHLLWVSEVQKVVGDFYKISIGNTIINNVFLLMKFRNSIKSEYGSYYIKEAVHREL